MSTSVSQVTLVTVMDTLGLESNTNITPAMGTPIPGTTLSDDTLQLLEQTANSLGQSTDNTRDQPSKRRRQEPPEGDTRSNYPKESKALYLKTKSLHRKKLTLAANIHHIKKNLQDNKFSVQANFNCKPLLIETLCSEKNGHKLPMMLNTS